MKRSFLTKHPKRSQIWSHRQGSSLQQRRLGKSQAELASDGHLLSLLDEIENLDGEESKSQHEETQVLQGLPLSPLMNPKFVSLRERRMRPKKRQDKENLSDIEKKLLMNPYGKTCALSTLNSVTKLSLYSAQALASPVRCCALTTARLPREFLLDFGLAKHPVTGVPWTIPVLAGLLSQQRLSKTAIDNDSSEPHSNPTEEESRPPPPAQAFTPENFTSEPATGIVPLKPPSDSHEPYPSPLLSKVSSPSIYRSGNHYLSSQSAMKLLSTAKKSVVSRTIPLNWKGDKVSELIWRRDMYIFVRDLLRNHAFEALKFSTTQYKSHVLENHPDVPLQLVSAALWLGKPDHPIPEDASSHTCSVALDDVRKGISSSAENEKSAGPPPYAMMSRPTGFNMPIYNLPVLLGAGRMQELRTVARVFSGETVFLRQREKTVKVQMALWKLMGYMSSVREGEGNEKWEEQNEIGGAKGEGRKGNAERLKREGKNHLGIEKEKA